MEERPLPVTVEIYDGGQRLYVGAPGKNSSGRRETLER